MALSMWTTSLWVAPIRGNKGRKNKNVLDGCQGRKRLLRGTTLLHPDLTARALQSAGRGFPSDTPALLRALPSQPNADTLGARLRDHVRPGLPYPFPPIRALCDVSPSLLFSSLPLGKPVQLSWNLGLVYTAPAGKSIVHFEQKNGEKVWTTRGKKRKNVDSDKKCPKFVKNKTRQAAL